MVEMYLTKEEAKYILEHLQMSKDSLEDVWTADWVDKDERDEEHEMLEKLILVIEEQLTEEEEDYGV